MRWQDRIPRSWRTRLQVMRRNFQDRKSGYAFAKPMGASNIDFTYSIELSQIIKPSHLFENKLHNISLAAKRINQVIIAPETIFSFWRVVGPPNQRNGFKAGRNLVGGHLVEGFGGGLCQLSGIIYHLSLLAGFELMERHAHSVDIYREEERYTPLGADATVVYGYRDLRIKNIFPFPVKFEINQTTKEVTAQLLSTKQIIKKPVKFVRQGGEGTEQVSTYRELDGQMELLHTINYKKVY